MVMVAVLVVGEETLEIILVHGDQKHDEQSHAHSQHLQQRVRPGAVFVVRGRQFGHLQMHSE